MKLSIIVIAIIIVILILWFLKANSPTINEGMCMCYGPQIRSVYLDQNQLQNDYYQGKFLPMFSGV